jgi:hypothetical protein
VLRMLLKRPTWASGGHVGDSVPTVQTLAERLGYTADDRLVIISCDDLGSCHGANEGVFAAMHEGVATCASQCVTGRPMTSVCTSR